MIAAKGGGSGQGGSALVSWESREVSGWGGEGNRVNPRIERTVVERFKN
jgi:hypothetical protein